MLVGSPSKLRICEPQQREDEQSSHIQQKESGKSVPWPSARLTLAGSAGLAPYLQNKPLNMCLSNDLKNPVSPPTCATGLNRCVSAFRAKG